MGHERSMVVNGQIWILLVMATVTNACPYPCTCTSYKVDCYGKGLKQIPDDLPSTVVSLDLQYNDIQDVGEQLHNLTSLQEVMLRFNKLVYLSDGSFANLPNLKHLNLGSNLITNLSANAFQNLPQLKILDLTDNQLTSVDGSFEGLSKLTKLVLTRNHIEELTENSLKPLTSLIYFMADENQISRIHPNAFHSLKELSFVSLSKNPLGSMDNVLSENTMLSYLNLEQCQLNRIPKGLPWATRNLQLSGNNITTISKDTFASTRFLGVIMLDENQITHIEPGAFTPIVHLQQIWLNGNQLSALPTPIPATVDTLSVENNDITTVRNNDFSHKSQMKFLSLRGNKIDRIDPFTFSRLTSLRKLYLSDNAITELQDKSFFGMRNLTMLEVGNNPITHIDVRFAAGLHKLDVLDLSYVDDTEPFVKGNFFRDIPFLKTLLLRSSPSLARNILTSNETLKSFYNLKNLDMRDNNLQSLDVDLPRFFHSLQTLQLARNAWVCDPSLLWLHDWMQSSRDIFVDVDEVLCAAPTHLAGSVIADLPYHAFFYTPTIATTTDEDIAGSGETDYTSEPGSGELTTVIPDQTSDFVKLSTAVVPLVTNSYQPETTELSVDLSTGETWTGHDSITTQTPKDTAQTTTQDSINDTGDKSPRVNGHTTTTKPPTGSSEVITTQSTTATTTLPEKASTEYKQTSKLETSTPTSPLLNKPTDVPRHGKSKTDPSSSFTRTIIIATCVAVVALIIVIVALVIILRHKWRFRLVLNRAVSPRSHSGDTAFVLSDQDEDDSTTPDSSPMTQMSESEQGSTPSVEIASDDGLCTRLV